MAKLEKALFYIFIFLIPFQIRFFLFSANNEWNSIFVYLGDIIFFLVFLLFLNRIKRKRFYFSKKSLFLLIFVLIAFISIFVSSATKISAFRWIKLVEFIILYTYIRKSIEFLRINKILSILVYSGVLQSILAIAQFIKQGSIGIKFIEAGVFSPNSPGVANFILDGNRILRSYGSFTHPNVLAGFLILAIFAFYTIWLRKPMGLIGYIGLIGLIAGLFLTFSRAAILVFMATSLMMFLFEFFKLRNLEHTEQRLNDGKKLMKLFGLVFVSCVLVVIVLLPYIKARVFATSIEEQAVDLRFFYNKIAAQIIKEKPILGIGIGNFVNYSHNYPVFLRAATKMVSGDINQIPDWIFQPEHNIYLLIASEMGILGLLVFIGFIGITYLAGRRVGPISLIRRIGPMGFVFIGFLIIGLVDHYFWTLQAGGMMFWLALALARMEMFPKEIK
jgi:O-antigen ligase